MEQEIKKAIQDALDNGHDKILSEVWSLQNLLVAFKYASMYEEEQSSCNLRPIDWPCIFEELGSITERIEETADNLKTQIECIEIKQADKRENNLQKKVVNG